MSRSGLSKLSGQVNRAYRAAHEAALKAGRALIRSRNQLEYADWAAWVAGNCDLSAKDARRYMQLAAADEEGRRSPPPPPSGHYKVVCGWCSFERRSRGLQPKLLAGPESAPVVRHGECEACRRALDAKLAVLQREDPFSLRADEATFTRLGASEWSACRSKVRSVYFHADRALEEAEALRSTVRNPGFAPGVGEALDDLLETQARLARLARELTLLCEESDYDDAAFGDGASP